MVKGRDFKANPYSKDEERVVKWLSDKGIGGGDDPIGFVMCSYDFMKHCINENSLERLMQF